MKLAILNFFVVVLISVLFDVLAEESVNYKHEARRIGNDEVSLTLGQHPTFEGVKCKRWHTCEHNYDCGKNGTCEFEYNPSFNGVYVMEDEELLFIMDKLSAISTLRMQQRYFKNIFGQKKSIFVIRCF